MTPKHRLTPLLNSSLRWFLLAMILANIAGHMLYSMLSLYLVNLGASVGQVGLVYTVAALVPVLTQLIGGWISDMIGRLRAIAIGSSIAVFGYLLIFIAPSWQWVMVGLCIEFISGSFVGPSFSAYVAEQSGESSRGRVFGLTRGIYMVVTVIGPALAGWLAGEYDFRPMLVVAFAFYLLATLVRIWMGISERFTHPVVTERPTIKGFFTQLSAMFALLFAGGILTWIWISDAIGDSTSTISWELFPIYMSKIGGLTVAQIGLLGSAWGIASIAGAFLGGWLTDRFSERKILAGAFTVVFISLVTMVLVRTLPGFLFSRLLSGLSIGTLMPAYDSLISKVVPEQRRGLAFGFFGTSLSLLALPMPWIGAQLWERISPQAPFWVTALACAITIPIIWTKFRLPKDEKPAEVN